MPALLSYFSYFQRPSGESVKIIAESGDGQMFESEDHESIPRKTIKYIYKEGEDYYAIIDKITPNVTQKDITVKLIESYYKLGTVLNKDEKTTKPHIFIDKCGVGAYYQLQGGSPNIDSLEQTRLLESIPEDIQQLMGDDLFERGTKFLPLQSEYVKNSLQSELAKTLYWDRTFMSDLAANIVYWHRHHGDVRINRFLQIMNIMPTEQMGLRTIIASILQKIQSKSSEDKIHKGNKLYKIAVFNAMNYC